MTDTKNLVERLLSGKPTPLEREAGEALASLADELRLAQERCEKLEQTISLAFLQLTMPSKFKYGAAKKTLMDAAASGPKEQKHNLKEDL